jgi:excisionase family DNA binding protein
MTKTPRDYLLADELAQLLGVTESTVRRKHKAGEIPGEPLGKNSVLFVRAELIAAGILPATLSELTVGSTLIACPECGSELIVQGAARIDHHEDGSHAVTYSGVAR